MSFEAVPEAAPNDMARVEDFAYEYGLNVLATNRAARTAVLTGDAVAMRAAFGVSLCYYETPREIYRSYSGPVCVPEELDGIVEALFGLDDRRVSAPVTDCPDLLLSSSPAIPKAHGRVPPKSSSPPAPDSAIPNTIAWTAGPPDPVYLSGDRHAGSTGIVLCGAFRNGDLQMELVRSAIERVTPCGRSSFDEILIEGPAGILDPEYGSGAGDISVALGQTTQLPGLSAPGASVAIYVAESTEQGWIDALTEAVTRHEPLHSLFVLDAEAPETGPADLWTALATAKVNEAMATAAARETAVAYVGRELSSLTRFVGAADRGW
jgi:kumamolisin